MRNQLLAIPVLVVLSACVSQDCAKPARAPGAEQSQKTSAAPVIQIHDVRDVATPPGGITQRKKPPARGAGGFREAQADVRT